MVNLRSLLLSLAFTLLLTLTLAQSEPSTPTVNTTNPTIDPCTTLGSRNGTNITYTDVSDCYKFIPFNRAQANNTLTTLYTLYNDFYVFRDASRNPIQLPPFSNESVDILGELDRIRGLSYANDFQFHADVRAAVGSLRDVHASYEVNCYTAYSFVQPLYLYAPVINVTQYVRVYKDNLNRNMQLEDCIVTTIDNVDALTYLRQAADELVHYSHDPNVRLNAVLTSQRYRTITEDIIESPGEFSRSRYLPKAAFVDYQLKCANSESPLMLRDEWLVEKLTNAEFDDRESYVENVCRAEPRVLPNPPSPPTRPSPGSPHKPSRTSSARRTSSHTPPPPRHTRTVHPPKRRQTVYAKRQYPAEPSPSPSPSLEPEPLPSPSSSLSPSPSLSPLPSPSPSPPIPSLPLPAQQYTHTQKTAISSDTTAFYQSLQKPTLGIMVVHSFAGGLPESEFDTILAGLSDLHVRNVTQLLIDLQVSEGGDVEFATRLVQMLFPNATLEGLGIGVDMRVNPSIQRLSKAILDEPQISGAPYDARMFVSLEDNNRHRYNDNSLFTNSTATTRFGRSANYTNPTTLFIRPLPSHITSAVSTFPWTNNATRIRLVTNGLCTGACGIAAYLLSSVQKVQPYGIGGSQITPLSMFSSPGSLGTTLDTIQQLYADHGVQSPMRDLPYKNRVRVSWAEFYSRVKGRNETLGNLFEGKEGGKLLLEYDAEAYPAYFRLDMWPEIARDRGVLWYKVGVISWGE